MTGAKATRLARMIRGRGGAEDRPGYDLLAGEVVAVTAGPPPTVTIKVGGSSKQIAGVRYSAGYLPVAGDVVKVDQRGPKLWVRGRFATDRLEGDRWLEGAEVGYDVSATGPGPDTWPQGFTWTRVTSAFAGRPGGVNGILTSYNAGDFTPSYQTYFTGTTMYVRNRATASTWSSWRVAWGPV